MIRHIILWKFKNELSETEKKQYAEKIKRELTALSLVIPSIREIEVQSIPLSSSSADMMLNSLFDHKDGLADYQVHPEHVKVKNFIGTVMQERLCMDYESES